MVTPFRKCLLSKPVWDCPGKVLTGAVPGWYVWSVASIGWPLMNGNVVGKDFDSSAGFAVVSANAAYRVNKYFKVSAGVDNLLDKDYSEHLNLAGNSSFGYSANTSVN